MSSAQAGYPHGAGHKPFASVLALLEGGEAGAAPAAAAHAGAAAVAHAAQSAAQAQNLRLSAAPAVAATVQPVSTGAVSEADRAAVAAYVRARSSVNDTCRTELRTKCGG